MPLDHNARIAHDTGNTEVRELLACLQGNILKGHGRDHTVHIFVKFSQKNVKTLRKNLIAFANDYVVSALQQQIEREQFKKYKIPGALFGNLFLTANGYRALGFTSEQLANAFAEEDLAFGTQSNFLEGMQAHGDELNDPTVNEWEEGYQGDAIDAMILLADDDRDYLHRQARTVINRIDDFCKILVVERGDALRDPITKEGIEHFGYVDGRSQPIYFKDDLDGESAITAWNPVEPLKFVLVRDKNVPDAECYGSYFVFRKLEQNVLAFRAHEIELADFLGFTTDEERARAGAMAVGRFRDGTPVVLQQTDGLVPPKENNFNFRNNNDPNNPKSDPNGLKCPFQAHIRKCNPRGDITGNPDDEGAERSRRITRRGITYDDRKSRLTDGECLQDLPTRNVGLLFMCFQASIRNQFAFMQRFWVNDEDFVKPGTGIDPIIGQAGASSIPQKWRPQWGDSETGNNGGTETKEFSFHGFVRLKGGEFFFAPSIPFLKTFAPPK
ncbi:MAG: Dyp-type peroxidase [Acidobacteriota bacterium]|nr:Dyp-type peroxidase [Acidobacteriota bacterium]